MAVYLLLRRAYQETFSRGRQKRKFNMKGEAIKRLKNSNATKEAAAQHFSHKRMDFIATHGHRNRRARKEHSET
jgi:hypothetical protein